MSRTPHKITLFRGLPRQGAYWFVGAIIISFLIHLGSYFGISKVHKSTHFQVPIGKDEKIPVRIVQKKSVRDKREKKTKRESEERLKSIIETPLTPTEPPPVASRLGAQDHLASKEMKAAMRQSVKGADPGLQKPDEKITADVPTVKESQPKSLRDSKNAQSIEAQPKPESPFPKQVMTSPTGVVSVPRPGENRPRNVYESLIPKSHELVQQVQSGYQDYIDDEIEVGDRVDFNTTNFRYLAYFTSVRKAFELVWAYPSEAVRRGLQGEVRLEFTIQKDGSVSRIRVLDSSGHKILDDSVIEAIKLSSPYSPLPPGMNKERLTIVGSFRYVLTSYAGAL